MLFLSIGQMMLARLERARMSVDGASDLRANRLLLKLLQLLDGFHGGHRSDVERF